MNEQKRAIYTEAFAYIERVSRSIGLTFYDVFKNISDVNIGAMKVAYFEFYIYVLSQFVNLSWKNEEKEEVLMEMERVLISFLVNSEDDLFKGFGDEKYNLVYQRMYDYVENREPFEMLYNNVQNARGWERFEKEYPGRLSNTVRIPEKELFQEFYQDYQKEMKISVDKIYEKNDSILSLNTYELRDRWMHGINATNIEGRTR